MVKNSSYIRSFQPIVCLQTKELETRSARSQIKFGMSGLGVAVLSRDGVLVTMTCPVMAVSVRVG